MTILVTGARGNIGSRVLNRLHSLGLSVRASSRTPDQLSVPVGVEKVALDLTLATPEALEGVKQVFLYAEPDGIEDLLGAAVTAGVEHVVLLSSNTVVLPGAVDDPLAQRHVVVEDAVTTSGLSYTILRPGPFAGNALSWRYPIQSGEPIEQAYVEAQVAPIHEDDVADVAVVALTGDTLRNRAVTLTGPESLTFAEEIQTLADLLGREIPVRELTHQEAVESMAKFVPPPVLTSLLAQWEAGVGTPADTGETAERFTGNRPRTYRQWVTENLAAFTG